MCRGRNFGFNLTNKISVKNLPQYLYISTNTIINMLDDPIVFSILFLVGFSLIFYVIVKNMIERKKEKEILKYEVTEKEVILQEKPTEKEVIFKEKPTEKEKISKVKPTAKFEVYKDKAGEYRFRLKAPNGEIIAISEGYRSKNSCMNGIKSVKKNVLKPQIVELKE